MNTSFLPQDIRWFTIQKIDDILHSLSPEHLSDEGLMKYLEWDDQEDTHFIIGVRNVSSVGTKCNPLETANRMIQGQWLNVKNIQPRASDPFFLQDLDQGSFVNKRPSRSVNEESRGFHQNQVLINYHMTGSVRKNHVDRDDVALFEQFSLGLDVAYTCRLGTFWRQIR